MADNDTFVRILSDRDGQKFAWEALKGCATGLPNKDDDLLDVIIDSVLAVERKTLEAAFMELLSFGGGFLVARSTIEDCTLLEAYATAYQIANGAR
ncbi:hypothetical protein LCGC14_2990030 [marine sediment metagenome]|uniref:Uncharacterized protein n=1 Tax=marine sediment metagenome TaxID=412755 RepID=A0A0F8X474_9ZZZZ